MAKVVQDRLGDRVTVYQGMILGTQLIRAKLMRI